MEVRESYQKFIELVTENHDLIVSSIGRPEGHHNDFEVLMFSQCIEYAKGIETLLSGYHLSAAQTLLRPMYESFYKGSWLALCATKDQFHYFLDHDILATRGSVKGYKYSPTSTDYKNKPGKSIFMRCIVDDVIKKKGYSRDYKILQDKIWSVLCSFTHAGVLSTYANQFWEKPTEPEAIEVSKVTSSLASLILSMTFEQLLHLSALRDSEKEEILSTAYEYHSIANDYLMSHVVAAKEVKQQG